LRIFLLVIVCLSAPVQLIAWKDSLSEITHYVAWDVKPCSLTVVRILLHFCITILNRPNAEHCAVSAASCIVD